MPKGVRRDYDELVQAVLHCNGDLSVMAKSLGITVASAQNHIYRYAELKEIYMAQRKGLKAEKEGNKEPTPVEEIEKLPVKEALSEIQMRVLGDIDKHSHGEWKNVDAHPTTILFKLEELGLITLRREGNHWDAKLTEDGDFVLVTGDFEIKVTPPTVLKQKPAPQKRSKPAQPITQFIGQEAAPKPAANGDCDDCDECLHREVLAYIMERVPEAKELYESIATIKANQKKVDAVLKKIGG